MEKKKVLLLGDSIRQSYCARVKELLADECEVYYVPDNGAYTLNTLWAVMLSWLPTLGIKGEELDLIHWNNGHWDHHRNLNDLEPLSTIEQYLYYNRRLHKHNGVVYHAGNKTLDKLNSTAHKVSGTLFYALHKTLYKVFTYASRARKSLRNGFYDVAYHR